MQSRRHFVKSIAASATATLFSNELLSTTPKKEELELACQQYTWFSFYRREGISWMEDAESSLKSYVQSGLKGYEPSFNNPEEVGKLSQQLDQHNLWSRSMYVNSTLHEPELVEQSIHDIMAIASAAVKIGIKILVTNPVPIRWGGPENKSDDQLKTQALALNVLGRELKNIGMVLAYHNHDAEMREGAREFHHMLTGTDPQNVKLCLDSHWIYRGAGNSQVALFDIVDMYMDRIVELHLRQSHDGIWSEVFGDGDIDYHRLEKVLRQNGIKPHLVLEQAVEEGTPKTMSIVEAMKKSVTEVRKIFGT